MAESIMSPCEKEKGLVRMDDYPINNDMNYSLKIGCVRKLLRVQLFINVPNYSQLFRNLITSLIVLSDLQGQLLSDYGYRTPMLICLGLFF